MNENRLAANRMNALKSTGPQSPQGKTRSSRNSLKHGLLAQAPILSGVESRKAWERHRYGVFKSIAPVGYVEEFLTNRLALISWRQCRVVRYEAEVASAAIAMTGPDMESRSELGSGKPSDPAEARARADRASAVVRLLSQLSSMADEEKLDTQVAVASLWALWRELPNNFDRISIPGVPDDNTEFDAFDSWTAGLLRNGLEAYAAAARIVPQALLKKCVLSVWKSREDAEAEERNLVERGQHWRLLLERENRSRMLLEPDVLDKVSRYDTSLERSFFRTLHEIQRLQASRCGAIVAPSAAIDVDLTVHSESAS